MRKNTFGLLAEYITIMLYIIRFYRILHHRRRKGVGEIDLIAVRANSLVFIEVKARNSYEYDEKLLSLNQQQRIKRAASLYLTSNPRFKNYQIRFDLVVITPYKLPVIINNAW